MATVRLAPGSGSENIEKAAELVLTEKKRKDLYFSEIHRNRPELKS